MASQQPLSASALSLVGPPHAPRSSSLPAGRRKIPQRYRYLPPAPALRTRIRRNLPEKRDRPGRPSIIHACADFPLLRRRSRVADRPAVVGHQPLQNGKPFAAHPNVHAQRVASCPSDTHPSPSINPAAYASVAGVLDGPSRSESGDILNDDVAGSKFPNEPCELPPKTRA
jgi:hypothetical protein